MRPLSLVVLLLLVQTLFPPVAFCAGNPGIEAQSELYRELHPFFPRAQWRFFDKRYESLSAETFTREFLPVFADNMNKRGLRGLSAGFSERQYAELCKSQLSIWLIQRYRRSVEAAAAVLITDAQARAAHPGLPSGWLLVSLDNRWHVFDAARFTLVTLEQFPECASVSAVQF